jgi:hypothetical protein
MNVKGSIFVEFVKAVRVGNKTGMFDKYLTDADREIIKQRIMPNLWYPYETFKNCLQAFFKTVANENLETIKEWGRKYSEMVMPKIYVAILKKDDPLSFIKRVGVFERNFFDFGRAEALLEGKTQAVYTTVDMDPEYAPFQYMIMGWVEHSLELCGAKNLKSTILTKSWEGGANTSVRLTWTVDNSS